ncbi:hypothetical protein [Nocardia sp. NRRL S-836]|uniref:hypothetical protein n=1 Tax=Nocardia sp. NRRL S-836 TaxID=1519492 RepID=UPI0006ADA498|nr:hypothetical protein [Nocardia sp. NRRL S-836]
MAIFGRREELRTVDTDNVPVDPSVVERLPDAGDFLLRNLSDLPENSLRELAAEIERVRHANGCITNRGLESVGVRDWKSGPLTHLVWITAPDWIIVGVWASSGLGGRDRRQVERTAENIAREQGVAAAATWALRSRPHGNLRIESLASQLGNSWSEWYGKLTNGDIIKSFKKWRRQAG